MIRRLLLPALLAFSSPLPAADEGPTGEAIFRDMCASCHGGKGEGVTKKYEDELYGERSLPSLSKYIDRTMPDDEEEKLDAAGSAKVAEYIYNAFYSPAARARNHPPRVELTHLTNRQYRESVADLLGSFIEQPEPGPATGLKAEYFESDGMNKKSKRKLEREDAVLEFDFKEGPPVEGCSAEQFSIGWQGSLVAEETGTYEFRLSTPNGARLYLNRDFRDGDRNMRDDSDARRQPALIDEWVSSGDKMRETTAKAFLLGGRRYPIRLDYFKFKEKRGFIKLEWKPPHGTWQVLRAPFLSPAKAAHVSIVSTPFPPDDGSNGYERGRTVSKDWHEATTKAALETVASVTERLRMLAKSREDSPDYAEKLKEFCRTLAERAFRRPLTDEEKTLYVDKHFTGKISAEVAVKRSVVLILKSPRFLYPDPGGKPDDFTIAARLALAVWDSVPDAILTDAAKKGELHTPEQVRAQTARMSQHSRAKAKLREFFDHWLAFELADEISKDRKEFPEFDEALVADLRTSLEKFVETTVWSETSDFRQLLLDDRLLLNPRLAKFYGTPPPAEDKFEPVKFDPAQRAGIFTHPFLLAAFAHNKTTSPIRRGVFLTRNVLGRFLKPPPMAIAFSDEKLDPSLTMREKVTELTKGANCMACHATINPLGFTLENYDAVGRWRTSDRDKPINPVSEYTTADGEVIKLSGPRDIARHAAEDGSAQRGFVRQLFHFTVKQDPAAYGPDTLHQLHAEFAKSGFNMRAMFAEIAARTALHGLP